MRSGSLPAGSTSDANAFAQILFAIFLIFQFPGFVYQFEYHGDTHSPSQVLQLINLMTGAFAVVMISGSRGGFATIGRCWPIFALVALTFVSAVWSTYPYGTGRASVTFLISSLFGLALAVRLPGLACLRFVIRVMTLGCLLSVVWALMLPQVGVHQLSDQFQTVHAGLWRGIFTHKQGLGVFAGLTLGLLAFYGSFAFPILPVRIAAMACAGACLYGTQSATGVVIAITTTASLFATYWISGLQFGSRWLALKILVIAFVTVLVAFYFDLLSFVPGLFGKSSDLTGRSESWWILRNNFANSGRLLLGGGYASDFIMEMSFGFAVDNGYLTKLVEFGYVGFTMVFSILGWVFFAGVGLVLRSPAQVAALRVFPASLMIVLAFFCITETGLMEKNIVTILISIAVYIVFQERGSRRKPIPRTRGRPGSVAGKRSDAIGQDSWRRGSKDHWSS